MKARLLDEQIGGERMLNPAAEERLRDAKLALDGATSDDIIELCRRYLAQLALYRGELFKLADTPGSDLRPGSSAPPEQIAATRRAIRLLIENTTRERERCERLLRSFTAISGYEAEATLNRLRYLGRDDWKLSSGGLASGEDGRLTVREAVEAASLLRREEHVATTRGLIPDDCAES